jgi:hypothetical protein
MTSPVQGGVPRLNAPTENFQNLVSTVQKLNQG